MHPMLNVAISAARKAGNLIAKYYESANGSREYRKSTAAFVSKVDREVEFLIIEVIRKFYPQHAIVSEESSEPISKNNDVQWIIDPLDGTSNFIKRFPHFSVSIAARIKGRTEVAVVYDPMRNELFTASRGQGAQLNGYRLRGSTARSLDGTILATSFSFRQKQYANRYTNLISKFFIKCSDLRCIGSGSLDLAYVAAGRVDGFFKIGLSSWHLVSGELLVRESGGLVTDFTGNYNYLISDNIVAGNSHIVRAMVLIMRDELNREQ